MLPVVALCSTREDTTVFPETIARIYDHMTPLFLCPGVQPFHPLLLLVQRVSIKVPQFNKKY